MPDSSAIGRLLVDATARLKAADVAETPRLDAILLLEQASGLSGNDIRLSPDLSVAPEVVARFEGLLRRRLAREPVSKIIGLREFWSLEFRTSRDVLDPRPDSETLIAGVLELVPNRAAPLRLVDFGTGSGCLLLSLLHELPHATGLGVDLSPAALAIAQENAHRLGLGPRASFRQGDWGEGIVETFDILISNPPYIDSSIVPTLEPEVVRYDPHLALDGGADGLETYRRLMPDLSRLAKPGAVAALEIGVGQDVAVASLLGGVGFAEIAVLPDLSGIGRVVRAAKSR